MTNDEVYVELTDDVQRIEVHFRYRAEDVEAVKTINGRRFHKETKTWSTPMDMKSARKLREIFGDRMKLGPAMRAWAKEQVKIERNLRQLNAASDAKLDHIPQVIEDVIAGRPIEHPSIPKRHVLRRQRKPRPYQRADIKLMSIANAVNGNDVGTGKTLEVIGAIYEAQLNPKPVLVIAPRRSLQNVWETEFSRLSDYRCLASEMPAQRRDYMTEMLKNFGTDEPLAIALIADDIRVEQYKSISDRQLETDLHMESELDPLHACADYKGNWYRFRSSLQRDFMCLPFGAFVIDEFHQVGLPNRNSLFSISAKLIKAERKWPMSATPIGGKARRLWPILNFIDPKKYTSEWNWINEFLEVEENEIHFKGGGGRTRTVKTVHGIKEGTEEHFWEEHRLQMTRRYKKDALPGLPDAVEILVETPMTGTQLKQYKQFDEDHEVVINGKRLSGSIVLSQYTRLRQIANARLTFLHDQDGKRDKQRPVATSDSSKLDHLIERLDECGIRKQDFEPGARAYIGVNDKSFLTQVIDRLEGAGIDVGRLDGGTKDSKPLIDRFNGGDEKPYVIAMTIKTGGTSLNLEAAGSAHALDEEWDPDVMTQFFGRGDRGARETALKCYTYRTPNSIQEYVAEVAGDKMLTNNNILDYKDQIEELRKGQK